MGVLKYVPPFANFFRIMEENKTANTQSQEELQNIIKDRYTILTLSSGRKVKIGYLRPDAQDLIDDIIVEHDKTVEQVKAGTITQKEGNKKTRAIYAKVIAAILLNHPIRLSMLWWLKWRVIHHFWNVNGEDYLNIIAEAKKKATEQQSYMAMALLMTMSDTIKMMTTKEAEAFRQELNSVREHLS